MIPAVLIIKNISHENPGLILDVLEENNILYEIIDLSNNINLPEIDNYSLIIVMGGPDSANDDTEKIIKELEYIKLAYKKGIPIFGICLGLQLMVKASGGEVYKNPVEEIGFKHENEWYCISLTEEGINDPLFHEIEKQFIVFQLHGETVRIDKTMKLLGTGRNCRNQIVKIGVLNYGFQFHFEITREMFNDWIILAPELRDKDKTSIIKDFNLIYNTYEKIGKKIFQNYLNLIDQFYIAN